MKLFILLAFVGLSVAYEQYVQQKTGTKCYQCSYSPAKTEVEQVKIPKIRYKEVKTSRTVTDYVQVYNTIQKTKKVPYQVTDHITVTRLVTEQYQVPRIVKTQRKVPRIVKDVIQKPRTAQYTVSVPIQRKRKVRISRQEKRPIQRYDHYGYPSTDYGYVTVWDVKYVPYTDYVTEYRTKLEFDIEVKPRTVYDTVTDEKTVYDRKTKTKLAYDTRPVQRTEYRLETYTVQQVESKPVQKVVYDTKQVPENYYETRTVTKTLAGGWDKCLGPFDAYQAKDYGIDEWECHDNCFTRTDKNGNVVRGCYKGEFGVDPNLIGCHQQAGATYCFCQGDLCNKDPVPSRPGL